MGIEMFDTTMAKLDNYYDLEGAESGKMPFTQFLFSPRVGFNWDVTGTQETQVRGGVGLFTSRLPLVWPAGSYTNNGMMVGDYTNYAPAAGSFNPVWNTQFVPVKTPGVPGAGSQIDLWSENFKMPQVLRANLAVDQKLPGGFVATFEGIFTKTINNVLYKNVNLKPAWGNATGTGDDRPLYNYSDEIESQYGQILLGTNTNEGYTYNVTAQLRKDFYFGLTANIAYTYGKAMSIFDGTSSQNSSQWNYLYSNPIPRNEAVLGISDFDMGSRVVGSLGYEFEYLDHAKTTIGLFYSGQSGRPLSYLYDDGYGNFTRESSYGRDMAYIPVDQNDIVLVDIGGGMTAAEQWTALDEFISSNEYLNSIRGEYAERNADRLPWENIFDLRVAQDFYLDVKGRRQTLQVTLDIFNVGNMINKNWGRSYYASNGSFYLLKFHSLVDDPGNVATDLTLPRFQYYAPSEGNPYYIDDAGLNSSRWQAQIGVRYFF
jgi:hypothetical protein